MKPKLYLVMAVLNEAPNVPRLLEDLSVVTAQIQNEFDSEVIVVDDGSTDGTSEVLKKCAGTLKLTILRHEVNQGPGGAFGTAFASLEKKLQREDWVATLEGDNTSRGQTLLQMLTRRKEGYDVVLASAYSYGGGFEGTPWWRRAFSHAANQLTLVVLRLYGLHTLSSFFRLHSAAKITELQSIYGPKVVEMPGFEWALEMLYKLVLIESKISEVETRVDWKNRKGPSKMKTWKTIKGYFRIYGSHGVWKRAAVEAA